MNWGWGNGSWSTMPWGGIVSVFIKTTFIKVKNYFESNIRTRVYKPMQIRFKKYMDTKIYNK